MLALPFPAIDPVLIQIGPFAIRWYALAYIAGLVLGWQYVKRLVQRPGWRLTPTDIDDLLIYVTLGVVIGGRLGYILFYRSGFSQCGTAACRSMAVRSGCSRLR